MKLIKVCIGSSCHIRGSYAVVQAFKRLIKENKLEDQFELEGSFCMGRCQNGVSIECEGRHYSASAETAEEVFQQIRGDN
ncbi:MAG: (2Fe-2S) ferredoxin domain-containing protein [Eubacteriaceae bacterium]|jgi:NADH:ubiquinone oxidoreductase subunit E